MQNPFTLTVDT